MKKLASLLSVLALVGGITLTGCKTTPASQDGRGAVEAFDAAAKTATISGTPYTLAANAEWPADLAIGDSASFTAEGTTISMISKIQPAMPAVVDSAAAAVGAAADSAASAVGSAAAAAGSAVGAAAGAAADAAGAAADSAAKAVK